MKDQELFDLFREQSEKLECPPTPPTWGRIERRIQSSRPSARRARVRRLPGAWGVAAGLALVIGLSVAFSWLGENRMTTPLAQDVAGTFVVEELPLQLEPPVAQDVILAHVHVKTTPAKPIIEGKPSQRLIARNEVPQERNAPRATPTPDSTERRTGR